MVTVSEKDLFFSHGVTALMSTICPVTVPHRGWRYVSIPLLRQEGFFLGIEMRDREVLKRFAEGVLAGLWCGSESEICAVLRRSPVVSMAVSALDSQKSIKSEYSHITAACKVSQGLKGLYTCHTVFLYMRSPLLPLVVKCMYCQNSHQ